MAGGAPAAELAGPGPFAGRPWRSPTSTSTRAQPAIATTRRSRGSVTFTAVDSGARGAHTIRLLLDPDGLVRQVLNPARFTPPPVRQAAPRVRAVSLGLEAGPFATAAAAAGR